MNTTFGDGLHITVRRRLRVEPFKGEFGETGALRAAVSRPAQRVQPATEVRPLVMRGVLLDQRDSHRVGSYHLFGSQRT